MDEELPNEELRWGISTRDGIEIVTVDGKKFTLGWKRVVREHSLEEFNSLYDAIRDAGAIISPIILDADDLVLDGHGRLRAAQLLRLRADQVPVVQCNKSGVEAMIEAARLNFARRQIGKDECLDAARRFYQEERLSLRQVASAVGVPERTLRRWFQANGVESPGRILGADGKEYPSTKPNGQVRRVPHLDENDDGGIPADDDPEVGPDDPWPNAQPEGERDADEDSDWLTSAMSEDAGASAGDSETSSQHSDAAEPQVGASPSDEPTSEAGDAEPAREWRPPEYQQLKKLKSTLGQMVRISEELGMLSPAFRQAYSTICRLFEDRRSKAWRARPRGNPAPSDANQQP